MDMNDVVDIEVIHSIPRQRQVQCSADEQLAALYIVADRLGLYDAADIVRALLERGTSHR